MIFRGMFSFEMRNLEAHPVAVGGIFEGAVKLQDGWVLVWLRDQFQYGDASLADTDMVSPRYMIPRSDFIRITVESDTWIRKARSS